jgi:coenzyme F420-reducing hydrogenase beta subunit
MADPQADGRFFRYRISRTVDDLAAGAKSRYYPVEMTDVLRAMRETPGRYAVVGIPCFVKAVQLLRREDPVLRERIAFTLGLFCGHMKSARFLDSFAWQLGVDPQDVVTADFRRKDPGRPANWYTVQLGLRDGRSVWQDWFHLAEGDWGSGFFQNGACNFCDDVVAETADISFGDAWVEPYSQDGRGTNVVLVRSPTLQQIVSEGIADQRLELEAVDADFVRRTQAAGFRQRREGLAYRLTWPRTGLQPRKRVRPGAGAVVTRRKLVYRTRAHISRFSRTLYRLADRFGQREAYFAWARGVLAVYQGLAYSRGRIGELLDRVWPRPAP